MPMPPPRSAIVLSAGGARGAYQVGVLAGIADVLGCRGADGPPLCEIIVGTSIGAINASYLAANADRCDHRIDGLLDIWRNLDFDETLRLSPRGLLGWRQDRASYVGRSLFDPRPISRLIGRAIAWDRMHANVDEAIVRALVIAAFELDSGSTKLFAELAPGVELLPYNQYALPPVVGPITADSLLASTALPFVFPALSIYSRRYMDGALRLSTPMVPALRAGAERVLVISLLHRPPALEGPSPYPSFRLLLGKVFGALLLDPILPDFYGLEKHNRVLELVAASVEPAVYEQIRAQLEQEELLPAQSIPTFEFRPSVDLGQLTAEFIREDLRKTKINPIKRALIRVLGRAEDDDAALLTSFLLLDGGLASRFIEQGLHDAHAASEELMDFYYG